MQDIRKRFGRRVREVRTSVGMTQERLALLSGLDRSYMGGIERGERNLGLVNIGQIATALGVPVADLFPSKEPKKVVSQDDARKSRETPGKRTTMANRAGRVGRPTVGCLFAAIGGFISAFESAGATVAWANEIDAFACQTMRHNFPHVRCIQEDVHRLSARRNLSPVDILTGGFPCQTFSQAGERAGFSDRRGLLFFEIARLLEEWGDDRPLFVVFENVKHLLAHDGGRTFAVIAARLRRAGYWLDESDFRVLDTSVYTPIPQHRERLFIVGASTAAFDRNPFTFPTPPARMRRLPLRSLLDLGRAAPEKYYIRPGDRQYQKFHRAISQGDRGSIYQLRRSYVRETRGGRCCTLTANMGKGGCNMPVIADRWGYRKLTPLECLRLQGYPRNFRYPHTLSDCQRYLQAGNSVTVPLVEMLAKEVVRCIHDRLPKSLCRPPRRSVARNA
jgi:DNA (cytosine-5)-methyltransferase 1